MPKEIPYYSTGPSHANLRNDLVETFEKVLDSNWYILGKELSSFEENFARYIKVKHCIGVASGLDALVLSLRCLNVCEGDEVIVPSNTYIATLLAVSNLGATPVLVEPKESTLNIDPGKIEEAISPKTKVILPVHLYGQSCEMDPILAIAQKHQLQIVEDNAQAQGASYKGKLTGSFGSINATSFYPSKNFGALGDAGAITTSSTTLSEKAKMLRNYGSIKKYRNEELGYNSRLDELQAALLKVKLSHLDKWNQQRASIFSTYKDELSHLEEIAFTELAPHSTSNHHIVCIRTRKRDKLQVFLKEKGIQTLIHYPIPPHLQTAYAHLGYQKGDFPIAEKIAETCLSLPCFPGIKEEEILYISEQVKAFFNA